MLTPKSYPFILLLFQLFSGYLASVLVSKQTPICLKHHRSQSRTKKKKKKSVEPPSQPIRNLNHRCFLPPLEDPTKKKSCQHHHHIATIANLTQTSQSLQEPNPTATDPKPILKSPNQLQLRRQRSSITANPGSSIFSLPCAGDPPPSVLTCHRDYRYTHSQAPVAATHRQQL